RSSTISASIAPENTGTSSSRAAAGSAKGRPCATSVDGAADDQTGLASTSITGPVLRPRVSDHVTAIQLPLDRIGSVRAAGVIVPLVKIDDVHHNAGFVSRQVRADEAVGGDEAARPAPRGGGVVDRDKDAGKPKSVERSTNRRVFVGSNARL